jgi:hypothetical protein
MLNSKQPIQTTDPNNRSKQPIQTTDPNNRSKQPIQTTDPNNRSKQPMKKSIAFLATMALAFSAVSQPKAQVDLTAGGDNAGILGNRPDFRISRTVTISVPDKAIEDSFHIATDLTVDMRRKAYQFFQKDGWLSVADGTNDPAASYDPRDFHFGSKCAAYLWGDDPELMSETGKRIFFDEHDQDGNLMWDSTHLQCAVQIAQVAKHFSEYLRYSERDEFITNHWNRLLTITKSTLAEYEPHNNGLIENGRRLQNRIWGYLVGEPEHGFIWDKTGSDVVVVPSMEVCEWLQLMADYGAAHHLPETDWLQTKAAQMRQAIETQAYDPDAGYYYLLYRDGEKKWYHSGNGIDETSRELDVTPYYAAFIAENDSRGQKVAEYARHVLMDDGIFPMPLTYPVYYWICPDYPFQGFVPGGCWEESYYNCVRAFSKFDMLDAVYASVKQRSDAIARDGRCMEWYTLKDGIGSGRDRYGISAAGHLSAIIEGLFGITPAKFGFDEVNIWPAMPASWADQPATIAVTLPDGGYLKYTYLYQPEKKIVTLTIETDRQRQGHFRVPVPGLVRSLTYPRNSNSSIQWNGEEVWPDIRKRADGRWEVVMLDRPFTKAILNIRLE